MTEYELGRHAEAIERLTVSTKRIEDKLDHVSSVLDQRKGERKTLAALASVAGAVMSLVVSVLFKLLAQHRP